MQKGNGIHVMAHRGFRGVAPENTLAAARKGHEAGAPWWELDVAASSDGVLVVIHDDNLARTTDAASVYADRKPWTVYDFSLAELKRLDAGSWYARTDPFGQVAAGRVGRDALEEFKGERIPTLREALEWSNSAGMKVNVEIKDASGRACDAWIVERTVEMILDLGMEKTVIISSFNHEYLKRVKTASPAVGTAALIDKPLADPVGLLRRIGAFALNPNAEYLDQGTTEKLRAAGFDVLVWTVNKEEDMRRLVDWGVTGLITDFPDKALMILAER